MRCLIALCYAAGTLAAGAQNQVVELYDGPAPGSEDWTQVEQKGTASFGGARVVYNVVNPTLTVFKPDPESANGTAVVICPGGAFYMLAIHHEGYDVARALNRKGITCFVLKYRLKEAKTDDPMREAMTSGNLDAAVAPIVKLALADGLKAMEHVRGYAEEYGVDPERIGIMGFSAGGTVAASVAYNYRPESKPSFVAPIYLAYSWTLKGDGVPADAPPMFLVAATDDPLLLAPHSVELYRDWASAGASAELHVYARGGHGFGLGSRDLPIGKWIQLFTDWLEMQGFLKTE